MRGASDLAIIKRDPNTRGGTQRKNRIGGRRAKRRRVRREKSGRGGRRRKIGQARLRSSQRAEVQRSSQRAEVRGSSQRAEVRGSHCDFIRLCGIGRGDEKGREEEVGRGCRPGDKFLVKVIQLLAPSSQLPALSLSGRARGAETVLAGC